MGRDAGRGQETEEPLRYDNPVNAPMRHYCHFLFSHPEMDRETQRDKANLPKITQHKGVRYWRLYIKCSFDHSSTRPGGSELKDHRGP